MSPTTALRLLHLALERALEHLSDAEVIASCSTEQHGGQLGLTRAAMVLVSIACDAQCAADYGPMATADEILRTLLGDLATMRRARRMGRETRILSREDAQN